MVPRYAFDILSGSFEPIYCVVENIGLRPTVE
jgi:hypothetical protein